MILLQEVCAQRKSSLSAIKAAGVMKMFTVPSVVCSRKHSYASHVTKAKPDSTVKRAGRETTTDMKEKSSSTL